MPNWATLVITSKQIISHGCDFVIFCPGMSWLIRTHFLPLCMLLVEAAHLDQARSAGVLWSTRSRSKPGICPGYRSFWNFLHVSLESSVLGTVSNILNIWIYLNIIIFFLDAGWTAVRDVCAIIRNNVYVQILETVYSCFRLNSLKPQGQSGSSFIPRALSTTFHESPLGGARQTHSSTASGREWSCVSVEGWELSRCWCTPPHSA